MKSNVALLVLLLTASTWMPPLASAGRVSPPFLKEILVGRCYETYPYHHENALNCDDIAGSFLNLLETRSESQITAQEFERVYIDRANFEPARDMIPMIWLRFHGFDTGSQGSMNTGMPWMSLEPPVGGFVRPEDTPGGKLLRNLVFCAASSPDAIDDGCKVEESNAYWQFWESAYRKFTTLAATSNGGKGGKDDDDDDESEGREKRLHIVLDHPLVDIQFLQRAVLDPWIDAISSSSSSSSSSLSIPASNQIDLWGVECNSTAMQTVTSYLMDSDMGVQPVNVTCHGPDWVGLVYFNTALDSMKTEAVAPRAMHRDDDDANGDEEIHSQISNNAEESTSQTSHHSSSSSSSSSYSRVGIAWWKILLLFVFVLVVGGFTAIHLRSNYWRRYFDGFDHDEFRSYIVKSLKNGNKATDGYGTNGNHDDNEDDVVDVEDEDLHSRSSGMMTVESFFVGATHPSQ